MRGLASMRCMWSRWRCGSESEVGDGSWPAVVVVADCSREELGYG
jgi:hypothetical protein